MARPPVRCHSGRRSPYIESLGDHWGDLCATRELASAWADQLLPTLKNVLRERKRGTYAFFSGATLCYSALFKAERHDQLLELLDMDPQPIWPYLLWGAKVLATRGHIDEAIAYLRERAGSTTSETSIARFAEEELLKAGRRAEAFNQYALLANPRRPPKVLHLWPPKLLHPGHVDLTH